MDKAQWKSVVAMVSGDLCVMIPGVHLMLKWSVGN